MGGRSQLRSARLTGLVALALVSQHCGGNEVESALEAETGEPPSLAGATHGTVDAVLEGPLSCFAGREADSLLLRMRFIIEGSSLSAEAWFPGEEPQAIVARHEDGAFRFAPFWLGDTNETVWMIEALTLRSEGDEISAEALVGKRETTGDFGYRCEPGEMSGVGVLDETPPSVRLQDGGPPAPGFAVVFSEPVDEQHGLAIRDPRTGADVPFTLTTPRYLAPGYLHSIYVLPEGNAWLASELLLTFGTLADFGGNRVAFELPVTPPETR